MLRLPRLCPKAMVMVLLCAAAGSAAADIYNSVEVRGEKYIPRDDIAETCGPLTGVELDRIDLAAVEDCLLYTGVFDDVSVTPRGDTLVIEVSETETRPGRIDLGLAYVNGEGVSATLDYEQYNILPDTYLAIRNMVSSEAKSYAVSALHQNVGPYDLHLGVDLAGQRTEFDNRNYATRVDQAEVFLGKKFDSGLRLDLGVGYRDQRLFGIKATASHILRQEAGSIYAPFLHAAVSYRFEEKENPLSYEMFVDGYLWNLGTNAKLLDLRLEAMGQYAISPKLSLHMGLRAGAVKSLGDVEPGLMDRGFLGGDSLRGFASRGLGPKSGTDMLGGDKYLMASFELQRDMGEVFGQAVRGGAFLDIGSVWHVSRNKNGRIDPLLDDKAHLRASLGLSVNMTLGNIPLQAYIAKPIKKRLGDEEQVFGLTAQTRF